MKGIIFDMDGLMVDTERLYFEAERGIAKKFGKTVEDETLWKMMGRSPLEAVRIYIDDLDLSITPEELLEIRDTVMTQKYQEDLEPMTGLFEIINQFHGNKKLAISTGSPKKYMDIVLDTLNIRKYFTVLQTSDTIKKGKPDPEIYLKTIEKLALQPAKCIVLEDSRNGALAGKEAGCYTIAVYSEYACNEDFGFTDFYAKDLLEARDHILSL